MALTSLLASIAGGATAAASGASAGAGIAGALSTIANSLGLSSLGSSLAATAGTTASGATVGTGVGTTIATGVGAGADIGATLGAATTAIQGGSGSDIVTAGLKGMGTGAATGLITGGLGAVANATGIAAKAGELASKVGQSIKGVGGKAIDAVKGAAQNVGNTASTGVATGGAAPITTAEGAAQVAPVSPTAAVTPQAQQVPAQVAPNATTAVQTPATQTAASTALQGYKGQLPDIMNKAGQVAAKAPDPKVAVGVTAKPSLDKLGTGAGYVTNSPKGTDVAVVKTPGDKALDFAKANAGGLISTGVSVGISTASMAQSAKQSEAALKMQQESLAYQQQADVSRRAETAKTKAELKYSAFADRENTQGFAQSLFGSEANNRIFAGTENIGTYSLLTPVADIRKATT